MTTTIAPIVTQVMLERLVDALDEAERIAWAEGELDRAKLRELLDQSMELATALLDAG